MNLNELSNEEFFEQIDSLNAERKDELYRYLWVNYVREDVREALKDYDTAHLSNKDIELLINDCADQLVYNGKYNCNMDYWSNLEELINDGFYLLKQKDK